MLRRRALGLGLSAAAGLWLARASAGAREAVVRVGTLSFGTLAWEMDVIKRHRLDARHGVAIRTVDLAGKDAAAVGLQAGSVDAIITDWLWVSRQRAAGADYAFVPHSLAAGAIYVRPDSGIATLAGLKGKRLGVAGGPVDKSWLIFRAYGEKALGGDLARLVEPVYAAPPLLNQLMLKGELPAVLNFWPYGARLQAAGMRALMSLAEAFPALGIARVPPIVGWVFSEGWAKADPQALEGLLAASREADMLLLHDDAEWETLRPLMHAEDEATFTALRDGYRRGIPAGFGPADLAAAKATFAILAALGGKALVGESRTLAPGTFWPTPAL